MWVREWGRHFKVKDRHSCGRVDSYQLSARDCRTVSFKPVCETTALTGWHNTEIYPS
jgi:hypothetical protein